MPVAHVGIGATVGSVIPTKNTIIPAAVGVDIGCGKDSPEHRPGRRADLVEVVHTLTQVLNYKGN